MNETDDRLLSDLARVLDQMDASAVADTTAARAAYAWRDIDAELADLMFDSAIDQHLDELVLRADCDNVRQLTFSTGDVSIEIEIDDATLIGQIVPPQPATVELLQGASQTRVLDTDEFGVFQVGDLSPGPSALLARAADDSWTVRTSWTVH